MKGMRDKALAAVRDLPNVIHEPITVRALNDVTILNSNNDAHRATTNCSSWCQTRADASTAFQIAVNVPSVTHAAGAAMYS